MFVRKTFPLKDVIIWTWRSLIFFLIISLVPVMLYTFMDFHFLSLPWLPIAVLGTTVAFIMGFKNNKIYDRVWEARKIWGGIINTSRALGVMAKDFVDNIHVQEGSTPMDEELLKREKQIFIERHVAWMTALRYALRTHKTWEQAMEEKNNLRFMQNNPVPERRRTLKEALRENLSEADLEKVMKHSNKATALLTMQSEHIEQLYRKGLIWKFSYLEMKRTINELFVLQGKSERIKNFPYPRQFATLNFWLVWIFIGLIPFGVMGPFHEMGLKLVDYYRAEGVVGGFPMYMAKNFIWLSVPFCTILSWVFNTIERVGDVSENPFEGTANDIPITSISRTIEIDLKEMLMMPNIPEPIQPRDNILL